MNPIQPPPTAVVASPIADLTYRGYDGPLYSRAARWWIVALATIRPTLRKPGFWITFALSMLIFFGFGFQLYIQASSNIQSLNPFETPDLHQRFAITFFQLYQVNDLLVFIMTLVVGAGCIAADMRANALLVYLSKPITKSDYLLGKWMGVFLTLFCAVLGPSLLLYLFCLLTFYSSGFLRNEPLLILRIVLACAVPAALYTGVMIGLSAWSKSGRTAGAALAGLYFGSALLSAIFVGTYAKANRPEAAQIASRCSLPGLSSGLRQDALGVTVQVMRRGENGVEMQKTTPPPAAGLLLAAGVLVAMGAGAARAKVRAVEVVKG